MAIDSINSTHLINIGLGFLEGLGLIVSPCILPILPIILAGSLTGSKKRPFGIVVGFVVIFSLVTFFSRALVRHTGIDLTLIRHASYGILFLIGIISLSTYLTEKFNYFTQKLGYFGANFSTATNPQGGFISGILFGGLTAILWTPCAGPILAAVIVQTVLEKTHLTSFLILIAFAIGTAVPMLGITLFGRRIIAKLGYLKNHGMLFRKIIGLAIILSVVYMVYEENPIGMAKAANLSNNKSGLHLQEGLSQPYKAPEIEGISAWINTSPITLASLKGHVILIDFWTYSCINCIRTLPYVKNWYNAYRANGLIVIGVHAPEFDFEKNLDNVKQAVERYKIHYPVALDNQFMTWQNYNNSYWPAEYLIDKNGYVVYSHFGEGKDDVTENNIRYLLGIDQPTPAVNRANIASHPVFELNVSETPETYLGYARANRFSSPESMKKDQIADYTFPGVLDRDEWALKGKWQVFSDRIVSQQKNAAIKIHFHARNVFMVMGSINDQPISVNVENKTIPIQKHRLYSIFSRQADSADGVVTITASSPGLEVYTFTFGE